MLYHIIYCLYHDPEGGTPITDETCHAGFPILPLDAIQSNVLALGIWEFGNLCFVFGGVCFVFWYVYLDQIYVFGGVYLKLGLCLLHLGLCIL